MAEFGRKALRSWRRLERSHAIVSAGIERALKSAGLPPLIWFRAFEEFGRQEWKSLRPFELQTPLGLEQPAVSRLLEKMTAAGMVSRREFAEDRRGWTIDVTPLGRETHARMAEAYGAALSTLFLAHLGDKQARALDEILGDLLDAVRA